MTILTVPLNDEMLTMVGTVDARGPTEGRPQNATARGETKRLDIRGDVEAYRRESLCTPVPTEGAGV